MGARDGGEIGEAQLELERAGQQVLLAQAASHHFAEAGERGLELRESGSVLGKGVFVADGLRAGGIADIVAVPAAGVESLRFPGQRQAKFAKALLEKCGVELREIAHFANAELMEVLLGNFAHARDLADVKG